MKAAFAVVVVLMCGCANSPDPGDGCPASRPDFSVATEAERDLFAYDVDAALDVEETVEETIDDVEISAISFDSPAGGRVTGMLFDPVTRSGPRPGIVLMHGMPGDARSMTGIGRVHAELGAVVIAIDAPFARRTGQPVRFIAADRAEQIQLIKDLQRTVDVLRGRANVDPERIAYVGISYGGAMGALFVGIERRLKAAALVVGDGGLVTHFTGPEDAQFLGTLSCETREAWFEAMTPVEPIRFLPQANVPGLLLQNGTLDNLVPQADALALHAAAPQNAKFLWYDAGHGLNQQALIERHDWLHAQIGLDVWP